MASPYFLLSSLTRAPIRSVSRTAWLSRMTDCYNTPIKKREILIRIEARHGSRCFVLTDLPLLQCAHDARRLSQSFGAWDTMS